jgi:hypothetical protein
MGATVGLTGALRPVGRVVFSGLAMAQTTDARDPLYDANSMLGQAAVRVALTGRLWVFTSALAQERKFSGRVSGEDTDSYQQLGAGLELPLGRSFDLLFRYAFARYTDPFGNEEDIQRFSFGVTWWPGGRGVRSLPPNLPLVDESEQKNLIRENTSHRFRFFAPDASSVSLVSDLNGWDPEKTPLRSTGDGWWEVDVSLPAGMYQYAYWVDGNMVTPPEAEITVNDGFGGINGLLQIVPK